MNYFFLGFGFFSGSVTFFGLPILISFIFSYVPTGYNASLVRGFILARCTRFSIVRCGSLDHSAISVKVSPIIQLIIAYFAEIVKCMNKKTLFLSKCVVKNVNILKILEIFYKYCLLKCLDYATLKM